MKKDLFADVAFDLDRFRADMRKTGARKDYAVFFTPRSGSSWLTDVIWQNRQLGWPEEWFNPSFVPKIAQSINADSLHNYIKMLKRKQAPGGIFGFEITYYQMKATFDGEDRFVSFFPAETAAFFLIREDIVLQAVSLAKSVASKVYHSVNAAPEELSRSDAGFRYDAREIGRWLHHILDQETRFERFFERHGIAPLRLSYERIMAAGPAATIALFGQHLGVATPDPGTGEGRHRKIGTDKNAAFAARFADEHPDVMESIAACRVGTLAALQAAPALEDLAATLPAVRTA